MNATLPGRPGHPGRPSFAVAAFAVLALLVPTADAAAGAPIGGVYQARPGAVLACGGFAGDCVLMTLEGTLTLEALALPIPGSKPTLHIRDSDLRLTPLAGGGGFAFPAPGDVQLGELPGVEEDGELFTFDEADGSTQDVHLVLRSHAGFGSERLLLHGYYDEGCCDRYRYDFGGIAFELLHPFTASPLGLANGRFRVTVEWQDFADGSGFGVPVATADRAGGFWFFRADNPELLVKIVPACAPFGRYWFFAAGLTNVEVTIRVEDTATGSTKTYVNPLGRPFEPVLDTDAFACP